MTLRTLEDHNRIMKAEFQTRNGNNIECPRCKHELVDILSIMLSNPPMTLIECLQCGYKGKRL